MKNNKTLVRDAATFSVDTLSSMTNITDRNKLASIRGSFVNHIINNNHKGEWSHHWSSFWSDYKRQRML